MEKYVVEQLKWIRSELDRGLVIEAYLDRVIKEYDDIQGTEEDNRREVFGRDTVRDRATEL